MKLSRFVKILEIKYPKLFSASWDNVGLLVNPQDLHINRILLTNDFSSAVLKEAKQKDCNLIICYHPVIFKGIKCLDMENSTKEALCLDAFINKIAVYCPHTILDCVIDGLNDWLIGALCQNNKGKIKPVKPFSLIKNYFSSVISVESSQPLNSLELNENIQFYVCDFNKKTYIFSDLHLSDQNWSYIIEDCYPESIDDIFFKNNFGDGRIVCLQNPINIEKCIDIVKKHLNISHVMVASPFNYNHTTKNITKIAVCAGSGGNVLRGVNVDLIITGELDHHSILEYIEKNTYVIVTNHSNSEKGFLNVYMEQIKSHFSRFITPSDAFPDIIVSCDDCDPLKFV